MATKTIIRYKPESPLVGRRELSAADFKSLGIFTQKTNLMFDKERNWWLDADVAKVSKEALQWFEDSPEFTVETQEVPDEEDEESLRHQEAYAASILAPGSSSQKAARAAAAALGESTTETPATATAKSTTTKSTAKS